MRAAGACVAVIALGVSAPALRAQHVAVPAAPRRHLGSLRGLLVVSGQC